jgi:hypothetical protein
LRFFYIFVFSQTTDAKLQYNFYAGSSTKLGVPTLIKNSKKMGLNLETPSAANMLRTIMTDPDLEEAVASRCEFVVGVLRQRGLMTNAIVRCNLI